MQSRDRPILVSSCFSAQIILVLFLLSDKALSTKQSYIFPEIVLCLMKLYVLFAFCINTIRSTKLVIMSGCHAIEAAP